MRGGEVGTPASRRRWYRHRFNTDRSWRLILAIVPRVPRPLRPALSFGATLVFFLLMGDERRAARKNLERVTGKDGAGGLLLTFRLFHNFSRFLTAYIDLPPYTGGRSRGPDLEVRVAGGEQALATLRSALSAGRGLILAGMHLGQWDMALILLARLGMPVTVVMRREDEDGARHAAAARAAAGVRVLHSLESPWLGVELLAALRRNEIVALQADRAYGDRTVRARFFGQAAEIPHGPWDLARVSGAPILPAAVVFEGGKGYRLICGEPIVCRDAAVAPLVASMESLIAAHPDQWFNFYDFWAADGRAPEERREEKPAAMIGSRRG